jgi:2-polyprenyl-6-methoxyphenol hydroxylase-like FAD-dependent oxidoreductase
MNVLIVGAGVAGPTLAYWLAEHGFRPTLLERAPAFRAGGYIIDFWGAGFDVAERMGLEPEIRRRGYRVKEVRLVGGSGATIGGFSAEVFERFAGGRYVSLPRGELARAIYDRLDERTERIFGDELLAIEHTPEDVRVTLRKGGLRTFDLVLGADGLHSNVRALTLGQEARFEKYLGYQVAAFEVVGYRPRDEDVYVLYTEPGQQVGRFAMRGDRTMFLFVWADAEGRPVPDTLADQRARLRARYQHSGWECPQIFDAMESCSEIYFDRVSQIRMERWSRGRVAVVGDAAYCVSLLAGQGTALAMIGAMVLAGELKAAGGDHRVAFDRYEARLRPFITGKQRAAERFASSFAPRTSIGLMLRNQTTRLLRLPFVAELAFGRSLRDAIELPNYG